MNKREFLQDQQNYLRAVTTLQGYPFWDTHLANESLQKDVKNGLADQIKPSALRKLRKEYQAFPTRVFCGHVHQEKRSQREKPYWILKRNKIGMKRHEEEAKDIKGDWERQHMEKDINELTELFKHF